MLGHKTSVNKFNRIQVMQSSSLATPDLNLKSALETGKSAYICTYLETK